MTESLGTNTSDVASTAAELCSRIGAGWNCRGVGTSTGYLLEVFQYSGDSITRNRQTCSSYLLVPGENVWRYQTRAVLYALGIGYCFIGLATITASFMRAMEAIVRHTRKVKKKNPITGIVEDVDVKIWNLAVADITLLALGTSSPQIWISLIDAVQHLGDSFLEGLGPGTLVGSAAFNLLPTLAVCVLVPTKGTVKRIEKLRLFSVELGWSIWGYIWLYIMLKVSSPDQISLLEAIATVLQFPLLILHAYAEDKCWPYVSIAFWNSKFLCVKPETEGNDEKQPQHADGDGSWWEGKLKKVFGWLQYKNLENRNHAASIEHVELGQLSSEASLSFGSYDEDRVACPCDNDVQLTEEGHSERSFFQQWKLQIHDALTVKVLYDENGTMVEPTLLQLLWHLVTLFWRILFSSVPPTSLLHGWVAFLTALGWIAAVSTVTIQLANLFGCVTGLNSYAISILILATGSSLPDLIASKIAVERGRTADSGIANINCSNCINVFVGIGVPWLLQVVYNLIHNGHGLGAETKGLSFSVTVFFAVFVLCWLWVFFRRFQFGGELGDHETGQEHLRVSLYYFGYYFFFSLA